MKKFAGIFFLLLQTWCCSQEDALRQKLRDHPSSDKARVELLISLAEELHHNSKHKEAAGSLEQAIRLADSLGFPDQAGVAYNELSVIQKELGNYARALEQVMKARKIARKAGNLRLDVSAAINCANIYFLKGDPKEAMRIQREALALALSDTSAALQRSVATCQGNLATCFHIAGNFDSAKVYYERALTYHLKHDQKSELAAQYTNIGALYWDQKQYTPALEHLEKAATLLRQEGDKVNVVAALLNMGEIYLDLKKPEKAMPLLQEALRIAHESQSRDRIMQSYFVMAEAFKRTGDPKQAVAYFERYSAMKDSLLNESNNKNIAEMQTRFETEKKEQEIELLQKDGSIRELQLSRQHANIRRQRILIYSFLGGTLLVLGLAIFIWKSYREKKKINEGLEKKNSEISRQKKQIEEKNLLITDSIEYAKNIQQAILPSPDKLRELLPQSFFLYQPKDVVSGDLYWVHPLRKGELLVAVVDCTGHGVPGAFMSVMAYNMLESIVADEKLEQPGAILDAMNRLVLETLQQGSDGASAKFGLDISLLHIDRNEMKATFAGAHNSLFLARKQQMATQSASGPAAAQATDVREPRLTEFKANNATIGMALEPFTAHTFYLQEGDLLYMFTDGYADQKGGPESRKFYSAALKNLLASISSESVEEQKNLLLRQLTDWMGDREQIDDILVAGIRV